jgi:hypothetical protein
MPAIGFHGAALIARAIVSASSGAGFLGMFSAPSALEPNPA